MNFKYAPGPQTIYIINRVIIPILAYRLQATPINVTTLNKIDTLLRVTTKSKFYFKHVTNLILYDKEYNLGLDHFRTIIDQRQITNATLHHRNDEILGDIHRLMAQLITTKLGNNKSILTCPTDKNLNPTPFILHISNILFDHDLQIRSITENSSNDIFIKFSPDSYNSYHKQILQFKIKNLDDVTTIPTIPPNNNLTLNSDNIRKSSRIKERTKNKLLQQIPQIT